jgi:signal transduction histidine kinase
MTLRRVKRLFHSVFTRLLIVTLIVGMAITFTVIVGFIAIRMHSKGALERNLLLYVEYLAGDLGVPPDEERAREITRRTGMTISYAHGDGSWQTGPPPRFFNPNRAWVRQRSPGIWVGSSKGHHFVRIFHGGGELTFIAPRDVRHGEEAGWILAGMAIPLALILGGAYWFIRRTLNPLRTLKAGVDQAGKGKLDHRIPRSGAGEFCDLADAFNAMAERLDRLLRSKEQLLLDVSHELRSPLTRLKVQLEFLKDTEMQESLRSDLAEIEAMVTSILESARMRHAAAALNLKSVNMGELVRSVAGGFSDIKPGVAVDELAEVPAVVDPEKIRTVLRNLLENALKHTPEDGPAVSIAVAVKPERIEIVVADKGEGIPASELSHLFEPFYRPDLSRSRKTGGYGLGLSLCKAIVDAHGGSIDLASTPGEGTTATVSLPRSADSQQS